MTGEDSSLHSRGCFDKTPALSSPPPSRTDGSHVALLCLWYLVSVDPIWFRISFHSSLLFRGKTNFSSCTATVFPSFMASVSFLFTLLASVPAGRAMGCD